MRFLKNIMTLVFICLGMNVMLFAQTDDMDFESINEETEGEWEDDDEILIVDVESVESQNSVDNIYEIVDLVQSRQQLEDDDESFAYSLALYSDVDGYVSYTPDKNRDAFLLKRYDVIKGYDDQEHYTYIKEYVFNKNQAWDYIYERIYDGDNGNLIYFVRRYNTYNSGCAEVAFEESEYFYNSKGDLIKKTYQIYDSQNNPLSIDDCYMDRESYEKYMSVKDFLNANHLSL